MTAIWLLPTRGRPEQCQETLDACMECGMTSPGVVWVDGPTTDRNDRLYRDLIIPFNWKVIFSPKRVRLAGSMTWQFETYPDATAYGWLSDDVRPRTEGFDVRLEEAAGTWDFAQANDLFLTKKHVIAVRDGKLMTSGLVWGGDLVRAAGWLTLPGLVHAGIDVTWGAIISRIGCGRYLDDVIVEHLQWKNGKRERDEYDVTLRDDDEIIRHDLATIKKFKGLEAPNNLWSIAKRVENARNLQRA